MRIRKIIEILVLAFVSTIIIPICFKPIRIRWKQYNRKFGSPSFFICWSATVEKAKIKRILINEVSENIVPNILIYSIVFRLSTWHFKWIDFKKYRKLQLWYCTMFWLYLSVWLYKLCLVSLFCPPLIEFDSKDLNNDTAVRRNILWELVQHFHTHSLPINILVSEFSVD